MTSINRAALGGLKVIELGTSGAPGFAGRWLAAFGAEVSVVEPAEGHWARYHRLSPEEDAPLGSLFRFLSAGKRVLKLDLEAAAGIESLRREIERAHAFIYDESSFTQSLDLEAIRQQNPGLSLVKVTTFGKDGPYAGYQSSPLTMMAMSGFQFIVGDPKRAPLSLPGLQADYMSGLYAAAGFLALVVAGTGGSAEVSTFESAASMFRATHGSNATMRHRNGSRYQDLYPNSLFRCKDGMISFAAFPQDMWERLTVMIEQPELIADERFETPVMRFQHADAIDALMRPWLQERTKRGVFEIAQSLWRLPSGPCFELGEAMQDEQYAERGFWVKPEGESLTFPGMPVTMSETPWRLGSPETGSDKLEMLAGLPIEDASPLKGIKMIDLTQVWAGPIATRVLTDLGVDAIRIERAIDDTAATPRLIEQLELHRNKRRVGLNLQSESGRETFRRLVADADILVENFSARVMANFGLDYDELRKINPGLIMLSLNGFGHVGPYRDYSAFGPAIEPMTGLTTLLGYPDDEPMGAAIAYADPVAGLAAVAAILTALVHKRRTSEGQYIDFSMIESTSNVVGEYFIERQVSGKEPPRMGNRHPEWSPQGTFRCAGEDEWVSISVRSDAEWQALCNSAGLLEFEGPQFATSAQRRSAQEAIEAAIEKWTLGLSKQDAMALLQGVGLAAGAVANAEDVRTDAHLNASGFFQYMAWPDGAGMEVSASPLLFNGKRRADWRGEPPPHVDDAPRGEASFLV